MILEDLLLLAKYASASSDHKEVLELPTHNNVCIDAWWYPLKQEITYSNREKAFKLIAPFIPDEVAYIKFYDKDDAEITPEYITLNLLGIANEPYGSQ